MEVLAFPRTPTQKWQNISAWCERAARSVPNAAEPSIEYLCPGDEWKLGRERGAIESDCWQQTESGIEQWLETQQWPKLSANAGFFARERLQWAGRIAALIATIPSTPEGCLGFADFVPQTRIRDVVQWLAIDVYGRGIEAPRRWRERAFDDLHR